MRRVIASLGILLLLSPLALACFFPEDNYALEVEVEKYNLNPLLSAKNVIVDDGRIVYRSHYHPKLVVIVWEEKNKLHVRVQIPTKFDVRYSGKFEGELPILELEGKAKALGWKVEENKFEKNESVVILTPKTVECKSDLDCKAGGCSGELCGPRNESLYSPCVYREWYECIKYTQCGCYLGVCTWKPNEEFLRCLAKYNVTFKKKFIIEFEGDLGEIERFLGVKIENATKSERMSVIPEIDPSKLDAGTAIVEELKWLRKAGVVYLDDRDLKEIKEVAKWGYAGYNSRIGFYDEKWIPYSNYSQAELIKCGGVGIAFNYTLPSSPPEIQEKTCGVGVILILALSVLALRRVK
ncbi:hypothetical protein PF0600 [Pyrococcus furiosus DSM 3638]|uniref:Eight-cysteine-cluster domain-containing protein n=1 Tax=Pyrococcus furiosus (strain ATCC 43587 / DSM 3638 / JCM 8422 / Vc1) TaxID=186497 RepID=Q8U372_PYRFU|nr:CGP-CTERM-anchored Cys-rich protein [Pyrococcus furiosus]AAL80724.1 hypothetical protein PF0600 [Pyrococcus furiosus DSM 3638]